MNSSIVLQAPDSDDDGDGKKKGKKGAKTPKDGKKKK